MNNIKVTAIKFMSRLLPRTENRFSPFESSQDVRADDLPDWVNKNIWEEFKKGRLVIPVMMTIQVDITGMNIADDVADEVLAVARRALKSVEYMNVTDRGAINSGWPLDIKPYVFTKKVSPLSVIEALTHGHTHSIHVIGFLTRAK